MIQVTLPEARAEIVADGTAPAAKRPTVTQAANGTPQVDIQRADGSGLSHNRYTRFDVDRQGVILNNARAPAKTRLAGWVNGNPNLAGGSARIILNEVNAADPSYLRGFVEVAGDRVQVIVANPAGITCAGCGFINANRATLTTGSPRFDNGTLAGFRVQGGEIHIEGQGLDGRDVDYTDLIARAVKVNAGIWAQELTVIAGANDVAIDSRLQTVHTAADKAPAFAIDVQALGGMYAGKILLMGTESGVGVRNAGLIGTTAGDVVITAAGELVNRQRIEAAAGLRIDAAGIDNRAGRLLSMGDLTLETEAGVVDNSAGLIHSDRTLTVSAGTLINSDTGSAVQGIEGTRLQLEVDRLDNAQGRIVAGQQLTLISSGQIDNSQAVISSGDQLLIRDLAPEPTLQVRNTAGTLVAGGTLHLNSYALTGDGQLQSSGDIDLTLQSELNNSGKIQADQRLALSTTAGLINSGQLQAQGQVSLHAGEIDNQETGEISATATELVATGRLTNQGIVDGVTTRLQADHIDNIGTGRLYGDRLVLAARQITNRESSGGAATVAARNRLDIGVDELINREGALLFSAGDLHIGGQLNDLNQAAGKAGGITNQSATIEALGRLQVTAGQLHNSNTHFTKEVHPVLVDEHHVERKWVSNEDYYAYDFLRNISEEVVTGSAPARLLAGGDMHLVVDSLLNDKSHILAGGTLTGDLGNLENREGVLERRVADRGEVWFSWIEHCGFLGRKKCRRQSARTPYAPADVITSITLPTARFEQHASVPGSDIQLDALSVAGNVGGVIRLPDSALYQTHPEPAHAQLIETDPLFAGYRQWLSSDYMLDQLQLDPAATQKRLGDGFYEQRLVQAQITELTGSRYLAGYQSDEDQYKGLMNAGVTFALAYDLQPGIALSAELMAHLTSDIVWLVEQDVTLADGSRQQVLVPRFYAVLEGGDVNGRGALLGGQQIDLDLTDDLHNEGTLRAERTLTLNARDINNRRGTLSAKTTALSAERDISNRAGRIQAEEHLSLQAGRDITVAAATREGVNQVGASRYERLHLDGIGTLRVMNPDGILMAAAGRDIHLTTAEVSNSGEGGSTALIAGNNINLDTTTTRQREAIVWDPRSHRTETREKAAGTRINSTGDLALLAGVDINSRGATINSDGSLEVSAGRDLNIGAGVDEQGISRRQYIAKRGLFSSKQTIDEQRSTVRQVVGSTLSAERVDLQAGQDLTVTGSQIVGSGDVTLQAGNNITLQSGEQTVSSYSYHQEKKSGLMTSGGFGITLGKREMSDEMDQQSSMAAGSTIGSIEGNVAIRSGGNYTQRGSDLLAPTGSVAIAAGDIAIVEARNSTVTRSESRFKQSGLTISLSSPVINAAQTVQQMYQSARRTDDPRLQALAAATAVLAGKDAYDQVKSGQGSKIGGRDGQIETGGTDPDGAPETRDATAIDKMGGLSINVSLGSSKSRSSSRIERTSAAGSTIQAGRDISLVATGGETDGNILVRGSQIGAGQAITLDSENNIELLAAQNSATRHDDNKSSSGSLGVSIGLGSEGTGVAVTASAARGHGATDSTELTHSNTRISAGRTASLRSGADTTLKGAVVEGTQVISRVGGDLLIESVQDHGSYVSEQRDSGGSLSVGPGTFGASLNSGKRDIRSDYISVTEQSGLKAGDDGFDIEVGKHTTLKGGVIASTQTAVDQDLNRFKTGGELALTDIDNRAAYKADAYGVTIGVGNSVSSSGAGVGSDKGSASGTTQASISGIAGNEAVRTGDGSGGIAPIFDADKVQREIEAQVVITQAFGSKATQAAKNFAQSKAQSSKENAARAKESADGRFEGKTEVEWNAEAQSWTGERLAVMNVVVAALSSNVEGTISVAGKEVLHMAALEMRQQMIEDSKKFPGICDSLGNCLDNKSGPSAGVNGDQFKLGGGRVDVDVLCGQNFSRCSTKKPDDPSIDMNDPRSKLAFNQNGQVVFNGNLAKYLHQHPEVISPLGGLQGGDGQIFGMPYQPGGWIDRVVEAYAGPHDQLNSGTWYGPDGNIKTGLTEEQRKVGELQNKVNVLIATPYALSILLPPELWQALRVAIMEARP
ncbi:hemagglutinin repeat-containing protein [Sedimenticola hydrogenitrophicus]|uniref:hemagglutinin repeat-containing protein n=1 Tax=Sedimenticola hydrogenitrophicus TaxID=2967975 RepID=UPI0021A26EAC|nr:hemagglutinin repeat-containing protein [Sedimenticola hydrogenitrophicus]